MTQNKPHLQVTAALIFDRQYVLITQRPTGSRHEGIWEFPGGKQEPGETLEDCLVREIREELGVRIEIEEYFLSVDHEYPDISLTLHAFIGRVVSGSPEALECADWDWILPAQLKNFDLLPPDRTIAKALEKRITGQS